MKTTIELPDELLARAKAIAAERRTSLKAIIEHALRRELSEAEKSEKECDWSSNEYGFPVLNRSKSPITSELIYEMLEEEG